MIISTRCLHRAVIIGFVTVCFLIMLTFASGAEHQNPSNYDFIEWQGWGGWDGVITGRVTDKNGNPIPHATVRVHSKDISVNADRNGFFTIRGLQQGGHYSLIITARGREVGVARLIPIPQFQSADIGDFSLDNEKIWTNFWVVSSNRFEETVWQYVSNFYAVEESITTVYSYAEWQLRFNPDYPGRYYGMPATMTVTRIEEQFDAVNGHSGLPAGSDAAHTNAPPDTAQPDDSSNHGGS